ncbi:hypothetical protein [Lewinella sp. JB7]|uniref:hypothetical protein n=1 Tax=Lewinella sp. JB7 TaxID=2962887 RepID=UPI0020C9B0CD|nr:hypothetical protein [Lewinella sp. JB7]MCP9237652.1 hypothetical protein [Lewinella sp. JB7]
MIGCQKVDDSPLGQYRRAVAAGLEADPSGGEAVFGIHLGDTDRAFFDRCTELNRQQIVTMAGGGNLVGHRLENDLDRPANMTFRPVFTEETPRKIGAMDLTFMYDDWSPWNKAAYTDKLLPEVADYLSRTLGVNFLEIEHPRLKRMYVHVDGSRHVAVWADDVSLVKGRITDLSELDADPLGLTP